MMHLEHENVEDQADGEELKEKHFDW